MKSILASGSWDGDVKLWDPRASKLVNSLPQDDQVRFIYIFVILSVKLKMHTFCYICDQKSSVKRLKIYFLIEQNLDHQI